MSSFLYWKFHLPNLQMSLNEEVNCTELFPSVSTPWFNYRLKVVHFLVDFPAHPSDQLVSVLRGPLRGCQEPRNRWWRLQSIPGVRCYEAYLLRHHHQCQISFQSSLTFAGYTIGHFVEQKLMLSSSFRCWQIRNCHRNNLSHALLCYLSQT